MQDGLLFSIGLIKYTLRTSPLLCIIIYLFLEFGDLSSSTIYIESDSDYDIYLQHFSKFDYFKLLDCILN